VRGQQALLVAYSGALSYAFLLRVSSMSVFKRNGKTCCAGIGAALILFCIVSCHETKSPKVKKAPQPHLIIISIDTLRADHVGAYGYSRATTPNLDAFAQDALVFDNFFVTTPSTLPSFASFFTGLYPLQHEVLYTAVRTRRVPILATGIPYLPELLPMYERVAIVSNPHLNEKNGFDRGFDRFHFDRLPREPKAAMEAGKTRTQRVAKLALKEIEAFSGEKPLFLWTHFLDPHGPYLPPDESLRLFRNDSLFRAAQDPSQWSSPEVKIHHSNNKENPAEVALRIARYDGEVHNTDKHIGLIFDALKKRGLFDNSFIVILSDHGESLGDHHYMQHGRLLNEGSIRVPFMLKVPGGKQGRREHFLANIDFLPTLLALLKVPGNFPLDGKDFSRLVWDGSGKQVRKSLALQTDLAHPDFALGLLEGKHKAMLAGKTQETKSPPFLPQPVEPSFIYTSVEEEFSLENLWSSYGQLPAQQKATLIEHKEGLEKLLKELMGTVNQAQKVDYSEDEIAEMRALGYVH